MLMYRGRWGWGAFLGKLMQVFEIAMRVETKFKPVFCLVFALRWSYFIPQTLFQVDVTV